MGRVVPWLRSPGKALTSLKSPSKSSSPTFTIPTTNVPMTQRQETPDDLEIHMFPMSQPSRSVALLLEMGGVQFRCTLTDLFAHQKSPNPMGGQVPYMVDAVHGVSMGEGAAIMTHLCETRPALAHFYPSDPVVRARVLYWLHFKHDGARQSTLFLRSILAQTGQTDQAAKLLKALEMWQLMESALTRQGTIFFAGDEITIADLFLLPEIDQLDHVLDAIFKDSIFPRLKAWRKHFHAIPAYEANFAPVNALLSEVFSVELVRHCRQTLDTLDPKIVSTVQDRAERSRPSFIAGMGTKPALTKLSSVQFMDFCRKQAEAARIGAVKPVSSSENGGGSMDASSSAGAAVDGARGGGAAGGENASDGGQAAGSATRGGKSTVKPLLTQPAVAPAPAAVLMTVAFTKTSADTRVGLHLAMIDGAVMVKVLNEGSLAANAGMAVGDVVKVVNGVDVSNAAVGAQMITALEGEVVVTLLRRRGEQ